jgi:hypothetical protein
MCAGSWQCVTVNLCGRSGCMPAWFLQCVGDCGGVFLKHHNWRTFLDTYLRKAFGECWQHAAQLTDWFWQLACR